MGIDLFVRVLRPYSAMIKKKKNWYKNLAVHLVQMALYNAFTLHRSAGQGGHYIVVLCDLCIGVGHRMLVLGS